MATTTTSLSTVEAEKHSLGSVLLEPRLVSELPEPADYLDPCNRACCEELLDMTVIGIQPDPVVLKHRLAGRPEFSGDFSPAAYITSIGREAVVTSANFNLHVNSVKQAAQKRRTAEIADRIRHDALNGKPIHETLAIGVAELQELQLSLVKQTRFSAMSAKELDSSEFCLDWLIDNLLVEGQPCIIAGSKKSLKTTLLMALLLSVAIGGDYLGKFRTRGARRVLFCSGESGMSTLQEMARRIAKTMGWRLADIPNFAITADLPRLDCIEDLADFENFLDSIRPEVLAIDPIYLAMGPNENGNLFAMGEVLLRLSQICQRRRITLILAHHTRKNTGRDTFDVPQLEDISWAGFQEFARQWILIGRRERYQPGSGEHQLWLSVGGSAGHGGLWAVDVSEGTAASPEGRFWRVEVNNSGDVQQQAQQRRAEAENEKASKQMDDDRQAVCRALAKAPKGLTKTAIGERAGISNRRWPKVFEAMLEVGELVPCQVMVSNHKRTTLGYKLSNHGDE